MSQKIAFDIGAYTGDTLNLFDNYDIVFAIEPVIENYLNLLKKKQDNVIPLFMALGNKTEYIGLFLGDRYDSSTIIKAKKFRNTIPIRFAISVKWDDLVDSLNIKKVDYVKVNIEGAEEMFLEGMTKVFPKEMKIQEHKRKGKTNIENFEKLIKNKGYKIIKKDHIEYYLKYEPRKIFSGKTIS